MAMQAPLANDKKRVKVYELRDNDWFDRGTGFCTGQVINVCRNAALHLKRLRLSRSEPGKERADRGSCTG